uniref:(California timema) hypothetical protein n=1 Tax=Timema californicum TaxID=61474 RepID=A0A7R9J250_TIMCA|nr:unnamed protein product [Timema californicum]
MADRHKIPSTITSEKNLLGPITATNTGMEKEARFQCLTMLSELDGEVKLEMIQGSGDDDDDDQESPLIMDTSLGTTFTAITLADGTQAFMAEDLGLKSDDLQGETLQLEDGSAVLIQEIPNFLEGQPITLEDGTTAFISSSNNEETYQPVELEDGSTGYISLSTGTLLESLDIDSMLEATSSTSQDNNDDDELVVKDRAKSFKCPHHGCPKLYTTPHHLKANNIIPLAIYIPPWTPQTQQSLENRFPHTAILQHYTSCLQETSKSNL